MSERQLRQGDHYARHCTPGRFSDDEDPTWLHYSAFETTPDNPKLSGLWVEFQRGSWEEQLEGTTAELRNSTRSVGPNDKLAVLEVALIETLGDHRSHRLSVHHTPDHDARLPSHAEIRGIPPSDHILQQKLADNAEITPVHSPTG